MQAFLSFLNGFLYTFALFLCCLILVVGIKSIIIAIKVFFSKKQPKSPPTPAQKPRVNKTTKPKPVRSIEINPEEIDRIYVKKSV